MSLLTLNIIDYSTSAMNSKKKKKKKLKPINELIIKFSNTYRFCNRDINKFILLLRKGIYLCG